MRSLWKLQQLDIEISQLESRKENIPREIQEASQKIKSKEEELSEKRKKHDYFSTQRRKLEQDVAETKDRVRRYKSQLLQVKTNREYQSLLHEINAEETKISAYEEESLETLTKSEELSKEIEKLSDELEKRRGKFEKYKNNMEKELSDVVNALHVKKGERAKLTEKVDRVFLARYEQIRKGRSGVGVVEISESICKGCNAIMPPQFIAEVKKGDKILTCEQCGRILVWKENVD